MGQILHATLACQLSPEEENYQRQSRAQGKASGLDSILVHHTKEDPNCLVLQENESQLGLNW